MWQAIKSPWSSGIPKTCCVESVPRKRDGTGTMATDCEGCRSGKPLDFDFSMAFQPIFDIAASRVWGYEALIRGTAGEGAYAILSKVSDEQRYRFDQACRVKALELAARLFPRGENTRLSINFLPNAVYEPAACLRATLIARAPPRFPARVADVRVHRERGDRRHRPSPEHPDRIPAPGLHHGARRLRRRPGRRCSPTSSPTSSSST